jgi:hypothetical protein
VPALLRFSGVVERDAAIEAWLAGLADPAGLLEGTGKRMRHVKIRPGLDLDAPALEALIGAANRDMVERVEEQSRCLK